MQTYRVDRINMITHKCQKKKTLKSVRCRYLAKSHIVNCNAQSQFFFYVNFRGTIFNKVKFNTSTITGCDFWGTTFKNCDFSNTNISDCVFMACKFSNCNFTGAIINYTIIINTSLSGCFNISLSDNVKILKQYPKCTMSDELYSALQFLKSNKNLRTYKLLHISDNKFNELNLYLLQQKFSDEVLPSLILKLAEHSTKNITTYKKLENQLKHFENGDII